MSHHHHEHHHHQRENIKKLWLAVIITCIFAAIEAVSGYLSGSLALLSDAGHMFADSLSLILAAVATWIAARPPSHKHSYGLGRAEVMAALISSIFIILVVIAITVEAIQRLQNPSPIAGGGVMVIAFVGLIVNISVALILARGEQSLNMRAALLHVLGDLLGSVAALIAGAVVYFTQWYPIDPILSFFICILILISSLRLLRDTLSVLMEGVPRHINLNEVGYRLANIKEIKSVHDLHIWTLSSGMIALTAHVTILRFEEWDRILGSIKHLLKNEFAIEHITIQPEMVSEAVLKPIDELKEH
ncbi:MAG: cation transporter [Legionellales bacterium]|nr:cation transporter [Legionellales bacterium]